MAKKDRFEKTYSQGTMNVIEDREGKTVVSPIMNG